MDILGGAHRRDRQGRFCRSFLLVAWYMAMIVVSNGSDIAEYSKYADSSRIVSVETALSNTGRSLSATEGKASSSSCEFHVEYSITSVNQNEFEAIMSVKSNRETSSPLQVVYRFIDALQKDLEYVTDAILVTRGNSTFGIPIRMKTFESYSQGETKKIKSATRFTNRPSPTTSLGIQDLNVNGIQCDPMSTKEKITYGRCMNAISFFESFNGRPPPTNGGMEECSMQFCCGVVAIPAETKQEMEIAPTVENTEPAPSPSTEVDNGGSRNESTIIQNPVSSNTSSVDVDPKGEGDTSTDQKNGGNSAVLIGAVVGVAAVLLIVLIISLLVIRSRRKNMKIDPNVNGSDSKPSGPRHQLSVKPTTVSNILATASTGSQLLRGRSSATQASIAGQADLPTPIDTLPDDLPEDVILHEQLGAGAFGTVFRGEWGGHTVAVKVLQTAYSSNSRELDSFRQEIAVLSGLRHPNIIAFLAACTISPDICIIEELAEGGSLHTKLHGPSGSENRCRPLSLTDAIQIAIDVAQAMVYLHPSIVHRDLKSQNVLLDSDGRAKVCDFGIAKFKDRTFVSTMNGQAGTPAYMAPELFDGVNATEKVDVYSYAILLWECITGKVPWGHVPSPMQIIYYVGVLNQRPTMPTTIHDSFKTLIEDCWKVDPKERPTFEEILNRLLDMQRNLDDGANTCHVREVERTAHGEDMTSMDTSSLTSSLSGASEFDGLRTDGSDIVQKKQTKTINMTACSLNGQCHTRSHPLPLDTANALD